jgi:exo-beta-1,3-glucanase (GH17 family)
MRPHKPALASCWRRDKPVLVGEVGWPSLSGTADTNEGSPANAAAFARAWVKVRVHLPRDVRANA